MLRRIERVLWTPVVPLLMLIYFGVRLAVTGVTGFRLFSTAWIATWFVLSIVNWRRDGQILRWLHSDDAEAEREDVN